MLRFKQHPVKELGFPQRGEFLIDLTKPEDPVIPEFLRDEITFMKNVIVRIEGNILRVLDPKYVPHRADELVRIVFIHNGEGQLVVHEGDKAILRYSMASVTAEGQTIYGYAVTM